MSKDIKAEDLHPQLKESLEEEPKSLKKFKSMANKLVDKVNGRINAERTAVRKKLSESLEGVHSNMTTFVKDTNNDLSKFKTRYEALYTDLVRRILVKMEGRVFAAELFEQATLDLIVEKVYRLEKGLDSEAELDHIDYQAYIEGCAADHEKLMQKHANAFANKQKEEDDLAIQKQEEESKAKNSGGTEDESSDSVDKEDSGAEDQSDGGDPKQASE